MKTTYKVIIVVVVILIGVRLYLPTLVKNYVNKSLAEIPEYTGSIADIDLHLFRGAYVIDSLTIEKEGGKVPVPFVSADRIDLSVEWRALFKGAIVGEIYLINPKLNFVASKDTTKQQDGEDVDWTKPIKDLMPIQVNIFVVENGTVHYSNFESDPQVDLYIEDIQMEATNLSNAEYDKDTLPASLDITATSLGGGKLAVKGGLNLIKKVPDADLELAFEEVDITALNDFLKAYANLDAERGVFNLYSEIVINDGNLSGYVKPIIRDLKLVDLDEEKESFWKKAWETVAGGIAELFENQPEDQVASRVPLEGDLSQPETKILPTVFSVFSNAFVEAFSLETDNTVEFSADEGSADEN